jgi:hypothetical protein
MPKTRIRSRVKKFSGCAAGAAADDVARQDEAAGYPSQGNAELCLSASSSIGPNLRRPNSSDPPLSGTSHEAASPGNSKPQSDVGRVFTLIDAEREHISEVVEMTNGLIAARAVPRRC